MKKLARHAFCTMLLLGVALAGCQRGSGTASTNSPLPAEFSFEVQANPPSGGSVDPAGGNYRNGWSFAATATPAQGYRFASWSGDVPAGQDGAANPITVVMDRHRSLNANFELIPTKSLNVTVTPAASGSVNPAGGDYAVGSVVSLMASPKPGYRFTFWSGDLPAGQGAAVNPLVVTMDGERTLRANFELASRAELIILTSVAATPATVAPGGTVTLSSWVVKNVGTGESGSFSNGFYLSADSVIDANDQYLDGNTNASLAPGAQFNWGGPTLTIPPDTALGDYYIGILVDKENLVPEPDENNNSALARVNVSAALPGTSGTVYRWALASSAPPLADPRVRQAISLAIDEQGITATVLAGQNARLEAQQEFASGLNDRTQAKNLLFEAAYPNGFKTSLFATPDQPIIRSLANAIKSQLASIGIDVSLSLYSSPGGFPSPVGMTLILAP